jgi:hypothetical protein
MPVELDSANIHDQHESVIQRDPVAALPALYLLTHNVEELGPCVITTTESIQRDQVAGLAVLYLLTHNVKELGTMRDHYD